MRLPKRIMFPHSFFSSWLIPDDAGCSGRVVWGVGLDRLNAEIVGSNHA
jgi:hypothetical protein